jgi:hypothetical protein
MRAPWFHAAVGVLTIAVGAGTAVAVTEGPRYTDPPAAAVAAAPARPAPLLDDPLAGVVIAPRDAAAEAQWDAAEEAAKAKRGPGARVQYFGQPWIDTDGNGCPTDRDIARRDLTGWTPAGRCDITGGSFTDYEGKVTPDGPRRKQLDHVAALHRVFTGGGAYLSQDDRIKIANDPDNLIYTSTHDNESKGDDTASEYLPSDPAQRCRYARQYVIVVKRYGLAVTQADADALRGALARC